MTSVALIEHGLQLAPVVAVDASPEQVGGPLGAATSTPNSQARRKSALSGAERLKMTSVANSIWAML
jgi:hypothetical protein